MAMLKMTVLRFLIDSKSLFIDTHWHSLLIERVPHNPTGTIHGHATRLFWLHTFHGSKIIFHWSVVKRCFHTAVTLFYL